MDFPEKDNILDFILRGENSLEMYLVGMVRKCKECEEKYTKKTIWNFFLSGNCLYFGTGFT